MSRRERGVRRGSRPGRAGFSWPRTQPSVYDHGLIGNRPTTALVSCCAASTGVPSALRKPEHLRPVRGRDRGGHIEVRPRRARSSRQRYVPGTPLLTTEFEGPGGERPRLTDLMAIDPLYPAIVEPRLVRIAESGARPVPLEVRVEPRFQYGLDGARWRAYRGRYFAQGPRGDTTSGGGSLGPPASRGEPSAPTAPFRPGRGRRSSSRGRPVTGRTRPRRSSWRRPPAGAGGSDGRATRPGDRGALARPGPARGVRPRLKLLSRPENGTFVAAPTTSLPEGPGGSRNGDYRYVGIRDAAFTAQVFALRGHPTEPFAYLRWVVRRIGFELARKGQLRALYDDAGGHDLSERELDHFEGYRGARPVRVGNAAAEEFQLDNFGEVLDAALLLREQDPTLGFLRSYGGPVSRLADRVTEVGRSPDRGLWEVRGAPARFVPSRLMARVALDRAVPISRILGGDERVGRWREGAHAVLSFLLEEGRDVEKGAFVQAVGHREIDAASLRIPLVGFLPFGDARVRSTIRGVGRELSDGPFVRRYPADDGVPGRRGHSLLCSFRLIEWLVRSGRRADAVRRWRVMLRIASPLGLYSEEYDPTGRRPLGNFPPAFTHMGLLGAAAALGHLPLPQARRGPTRPASRSSLPADGRERAR